MTELVVAVETLLIGALGVIAFIASVMPFIGRVHLGPDTEVNQWKGIWSLCMQQSSSQGIGMTFPALLVFALLYVVGAVVEGWSFKSYDYLRHDELVVEAFNDFHSIISEHERSMHSGFATLKTTKASTAWLASLIAPGPRDQDSPSSESLHVDPLAVRYLYGRVALYEIAGREPKRSERALTLIRFARGGWFLFTMVAAFRLVAAIGWIARKGSRKSDAWILLTLILFGLACWFALEFMEHEYHNQLYMDAYMRLINSLN